MCVIKWSTASRSTFGPVIILQLKISVPISRRRMSLVVAGPNDSKLKRLADPARVHPTNRYGVEWQQDKKIYISRQTTFNSNFYPLDFRRINNCVCVIKFVLRYYICVHMKCGIQRFFNEADGKTKLPRIAGELNLWVKKASGEWSNWFASEP